MRGGGANTGDRPKILTRNIGAGKDSLIQVQEVRAGSSYLSMDSIDLEFGLGVATVVEVITIFWPGGREQVLGDVPADQVLAITVPGE